MRVGTTGTVQRSGGSSRFGNGQVCIGDPVKSVPKPGTERAVVDRATDLEQQISAIPGRVRLGNYSGPPLAVVKLNDRFGSVESRPALAADAAEGQPSFGLSCMRFRLRR